MVQNQAKKVEESFLESLRQAKDLFRCKGLPSPARAWMIHKIVRELQRPLLLVTSNQGDAESLFETLSFFSGAPETSLALFSPYLALPYQAMARHTGTVARRMALLHDLVSGKTPDVLIVSAENLVQKILPRDVFEKASQEILLYDTLDRETLIAKMIASGYQKVPLVEEPGDFALRGGILDVFSPAHDDPIRIELDGDDVVSLRFFSAASQKKLQDTEQATILPVNEMVLFGSSMEAFLGRIRQEAASLGLKLTRVREIVERIRETGIDPVLDGQLSLLYAQPETLLDYLSNRTLFICDEPGLGAGFVARQKDRVARSREEALGLERVVVPMESLYEDWDTVFSRMKTRGCILLGNPDMLEGETTVFDFHVADNTIIRGELRARYGGAQPLLPLVDWIAGHKRNGLRVLIVCSGPVQLQRVHDLIAAYGISSQIRESFREVMDSRIPTVFLCEGRLKEGFVWEEEKLALISDEEIFGPKRRKRKVSKARAKDRFLNLDELKEGDIVVHVDHGLGRFEGIEKLSMNGVVSDFIRLSYRDGDLLYVPVDRMGVVRKYLGMDGIEPILDKMGGKTWDKTKEKAKASVEKMAGELLSLYAARKVHVRDPFMPVDVQFQDFEASFPHEETPDQLRVIHEIFEDMDSDRPMDRLVCGDVGYGKTEVALRAAFRAVMDGSQVAVLAPTTVLAEQHYRSFSQRFEAYPVRIAALDRFRSKAEQKKILGEMAAGTLDIVVGTHRLLQKDVQFHKLGLLVIDEEQRFGVRHKETLKKMRETVDVLALTATPIPRTLHMALMGMRDISVIATPPEERQAIISYVSAYEEGLVREAVMRERERGGQIFFVHNHIATIESQAARLREILPDVRIGVAHGRMKEDDLEKEMISFVTGETDMLVCTTIIESGLDIPSANTMLVNRADLFGLSQLYQLRGRIGRREVQAYAYLFVPEEKKLSRDAIRRLKVLMEYSDLGSGFQIAMNDLQIRGGGAALGADQSGHIAAVGYEMFLQLMENAISELKGESVLEPLDPEINFTMNAYIPESYVPDIDQRIAIYRKLSRMLSLGEIRIFREELQERYGALPPEADNILLKIMLKVLCIKAGIRRLDLGDKHLILGFSRLHQKKSFALASLSDVIELSMEFVSEDTLKIHLARDRKTPLLRQARNILKEIAAHVNR